MSEPTGFWTLQIIIDSPLDYDGGAHILRINAQSNLASVPSEIFIHRNRIDGEKEFYAVASLNQLRHWPANQPDPPFPDGSINPFYRLSSMSAAMPSRADAKKLLDDIIADIHWLRAAIEAEQALTNYSTVEI